MAGAKLQDVAKNAGVSLATASLALSGKGRISAEVRARVRETAAQLGYRSRPHVLAHNLGGRACVGILHHDGHAFEWNFIRPTLLELQRGMLQRGYFPIVIPMDPEKGAERALSLAAAWDVAGVFSVHYADEALFAELEQRGVSVVLINNSNFQDRFYSVCVDDFQGAYEGTTYLIGLGHRSIAFVEYERPELPAVVADRFVGYRKALEEAGLPFSAEQRITVSFMDLAVLTRRLETLFRGTGRPTAVFAHDDFLGVYVVEALRALGLRVPDDVSLLAPGDVLDYTLPFTPQITTMRINTTLLGRIAADLLVDRINRGHEDVHVLKVKEQLVRRQSCRSLQPPEKEGQA
jgi:LacI family transcriptional regulator